jgi:mannose-6-phosphate isomerase-like protein (cupin superfamily)
VFFVIFAVKFFSGTGFARANLIDLLGKVANISRMKPITKSILALSVAGVIGLAFAAEPSQPTQPVTYIPHQIMDNDFKAGGMILQTNNYKVMAGRRVGPGAVEIHEKDTDVFYIVDGTATFITGGKANEVKEKDGSPGEFGAKDITGGETHHLTKGDVIVIPNGVPHWFTETSVPFLYFVVKVAK